MDKDQAYEITWLVRRLFRAMAARTDRYLADASLTAADRAVLEFLYPRDRLSVPGIAERYQVSRQHVQVTVNRLLDRALLRSEDNPKHKRSPLLRLSREGRDRFDRIRADERRVLEEIFSGIPECDLDATRRTLGILQQRLTGE